MNNLNVLIVSRVALYPGYLEEIAAVDPRIAVKDACALVVAELRQKGSQSMWLEEIEKELVNNPAPELHDNLDHLLSEAEVIFGTSQYPSDLVRRAPRLKWLHLATAGIDTYVSTLINSNILITNSRGAHAVGIAEHVLSFALGLAKHVPEQAVNKQAHRSERLTNLELGGRVMGVIGMGAIGTEIARLARGIGMKVIGVRRSAAKHETGVCGIDDMYPISELRTVLSRSDVVVLAVPLTPETTRMIGARELGWMKPSAFLINIARGQVVDQDALIKALKERRIAGAGLDVFEREPLPADSEIWSLPNVMLSPHVAGSTDGRPRRIIRIFCENLRRYLAGEPLLNQVDLKRGY